VILFTSQLEWCRPSAPPPALTEVIALTVSGETGQAMWDAGQWWWSDGHEITDVAAWAALPDGGQLNIAHSAVLHGKKRA
jgi:hypothetical protein